MLTTTSETLGSAKAPVLPRVTVTTFLHRGFLINSCTMRPPTFPVAPRIITEYSASASVVTSHPSQPQSIDTVPAPSINSQVPSFTRQHKDEVHPSNPGTIGAVP